MVKHIILWTLKDEFNKDEIKKDMKQKSNSYKVAKNLNLRYNINIMKGRERYEFFKEII